MIASPVLQHFSETHFVREPRLGAMVAARQRASGPAVNFLADLSILPQWWVAGADAHHALDLGHALDGAFFVRQALAPGRWYVRVGEQRTLVATSPIESAADAIRPAAPAAHPGVLWAEAAQFALGGPAASRIVRELAAFDPMPVLGPTAYLPLLLAQHEAALYRDGDVILVQTTAADGASLFEVLTAALHEAGGALIGYDDYLSPGSGVCA